MTNQTIYTVGGTVQAGGGVYIPRKADDELLEYCRAGENAFILSSRQVGKSSLMVRTARQLEHENFCTVIIDLSEIGVKNSADEWYLGILYKITEELNLKADIFSWWSERTGLGSTQRMTNFFRDVLLKEVSKPIVLFFDEIDSTLSISFADDFFAALRAVYNARATTPVFGRLSFVLIGVATPSDLIKDIKRTPFNIGRRVELTDFTLEESIPLAEGLGTNAVDVLSWILEWTGGHPYLTQLLCAHLAKSNTQLLKSSVSDAVNLLFDGEQGRQDHNLQFVRDMLTRRAPNTLLVLKTYKDICIGKTVEDDDRSEIKAHIKISGIAHRVNGYLIVRNKIYAKKFDSNWIKENSPKENYSTYTTLRRIVIVFVLATVFSILMYALLSNIDASFSMRYVIISLIAFSVLVLILVTGVLWIKRDVVVEENIRQRVGNVIERLTMRLRKSEPKARLIVVQGISDGNRKEFDLFGETPIGRSPENAELIFDNDNISRLHCIIHGGHTGNWTIEDQESANGTFVNGQKLTPFVEKEIETGMLIELGPVEYGGIKFRFDVLDAFSRDDGIYQNIYDKESLDVSEHTEAVRITKPKVVNKQENHFDPSDPKNQKW